MLAACCGHREVTGGQNVSDFLILVFAIVINLSSFMILFYY